MHMEQNEILQSNEILAIKQENQRLQLELDEYENEVCFFQKLCYLTVNELNILSPYN